MGLVPADEPLSARITIRTYQREDHKVVCELFREGILATYCRDGENEYMRDFVDRSLQNDLADIEASYLAAGGHFSVASVSSDNNNDGNATDQVIGCLGLQVGDDKRSKLCRLSIHTDFRRRGVAQKLVERAEQWSSERGLDAVSLGTFGEMVPAIKLYEAMGYTRTKEEPWPRDPKVVVVHFEKKL